MVEIIIWDIPSIFLGGIAFCILCIGGFLYLKKGIKSEVFKEKIIIFGYTGIFLSFACLVLFYALGALYMAGTYKNFAFFGDLSRVNALSDILFRATYSSMFFGFLFFILLFEFNFKRTKYILSIIGFFLIIAALLAPSNSEINMIPYVYNLIMAVLVLLIFTNWSKFENRIISSFILMGCVCIGWAGGFIGMSIIYERNVLPMWLSSLLICIGGIIMITTLFISPKNLSRSLFYSLMFFCYSFVLVLQISFLLVQIYAGLPITNIIITLVFTVLYVYGLFTNVKAKKSYRSGSIPSEDKEFHPDILSMFVRPQRLTEEEVTVAKEKKICLICKNKVSRFDIYICPECDTLYCENCAKTLSDLENICWVCETPFDASKPIKTGQEKEEIEIKDSEMSQKKRNEKK